MGLIKAKIPREDTTIVFSYSRGMTLQKPIASCYASATAEDHSPPGRRLGKFRLSMVWALLPR